VYLAQNIKILLDGWQAEAIYLGLRFGFKSTLEITLKKIAPVDLSGLAGK